MPSLQVQQDAQIPEDKRIPPFRLFGNTYFVGTYSASSHLIDTGDGLILLDTGYAETAPVILAGIRDLGFKIEDVKIILHSHGHQDHTGGTPALLSLCHARTYLCREDLRYISGFAPDVFLQDGGHIRLGNTDIVCLHTPGHTNGTFSFFYEAEENGRRLRVGTFGGAGTNQLKKDYLDQHGLSTRQRGDFFRSLERLRGEKAEVFLGNHSWQNETLQNYRRSLTMQENPFVDAGRWLPFLDQCEKKLLDVIHGESRSRFVNYAHRGASAYAPENTLLSFYTGIYMGANGVETDVQRTRDGVLVLYHDNTLLRMTGNSGSVCDYTVEELQKMSLTVNGLTDRIVTLEDFLDHFAFRSITFAIELKCEGVEREVAELIRKYGIADRTVITSFRLNCLRAARACAPDLRIGFLCHAPTDEELESYAELALDEICPKAAETTRENVEHWHRLGYRVRAWGVSNEEEMRRLYDIGVDGMTVNFPDKLAAYMAAAAES